MYLPLKENTHMYWKYPPPPPNKNLPTSRPPQAAMERPWRLCWCSTLTANIALHSLFILSVLGPAWFTSSPLRSLAANRLWASGLSIMEGLWQSSDSHTELILQACCLFSRRHRDPSLGSIGSSACLNPRTHDFPPLHDPPNFFLSSYRTTDKIMGACFPLLSFWNYFQPDNELWEAAAGKKRMRHIFAPECFTFTNSIYFTTWIFFSKIISIHTFT